MNAKEKYPKTLLEAVRYFSDLDVAHDFFTSIRWPSGQVCCPTCGSVEVKYLANYRRWECKEKHSRRQFTVKVGTIMEDSPLGLDKWAVSFWLEANAKNSISSYEIHRALGVTQKSAWFMQHRVRLAMQSKSDAKLLGAIEADESFVGGRLQNMHAKRRKQFQGKGSDKNAGKAIVFGLLARGGDVRAEVVDNTKRRELFPIIARHVVPGSMIVTDSHRPYRHLYPTYVHEFVDHSIEYVRGYVHTNGLENFWSLFKRCLKGTHVSVEPAHLFRYLDAEMFRNNLRKLTDGERLIRATNGMTGKRLTYKALIGTREYRIANGGNAESDARPN